MDFAIGSRLSAAVLGFVGGGLALFLGLLMLLFGGVLDVVSANNGNSIALSGFLVTVFSLGAIAAAALYFLPWANVAFIAMAFVLALLLWAFVRVDAWALGLIPILPLACSVLLGLSAVVRAAPVRS